MTAWSNAWNANVQTTCIHNVDIAVNTSKMCFSERITPVNKSTQSWLIKVSLYAFADTIGWLQLSYFLKKLDDVHESNVYVKSRLIKHKIRSKTVTQAMDCTWETKRPFASLGPRRQHSIPAIDLLG